MLSTVRSRRRADRDHSRSCNLPEVQPGPREDQEPLGTESRVRSACRASNPLTGTPGSWPPLRQVSTGVEFVTFALAGAAASIRRVEAVLMGRPGSWQAEGIRQLLAPTAGDDDQLLAHRTEPVVTNLYVDEITLDAGVWAAYDQASDELDRRYDASWADPSKPPSAEHERESEVVANLTERLET
jgi:hypothetical protein